MKKKIVLLVLAVLVFCIGLTACRNKEVTGISLVDGTFKYTYELGETPDFSGVQAQIKYNDGSSKVVEGKNLSFGALDTSKPGVVSLAITYEKYTLYVDVTVEGKNIGGNTGNGENNTDTRVLESIEIVKASVPEKVLVGGYLDISKIKVAANYSDDTVEYVSAMFLNVTNIDASTKGTKTLKATYLGFEANLDIEVIGVKSMTVIDGTVANSLLTGDSFSALGISVSVVFTDDSTKTLSYADLQIGGISTATAGEKSLGISYLDGSTTYTVTVYGVESIEVDADSIDTKLNAGEIPDISNMKVYAVYGNGVRKLIDAADITTNKDSVNWNEEGNKNLVINYGDLSTEIIISSDDPILTGIEITEYKNKIGIGKTYDNSTVVVVASYGNNTKKTVSATVGTIDTATAGDKTLTASYTEGDVTKTAEKTVKVLSIKSISVTNVPAIVNIGTSFSSENISVTVIYEDDSVEAVANSLVSFSAIDSSTSGDKTLTVTYLGVSTTAKVHVKGVASMSLVPGTLNNKTYQGDAINTNGVKVNVVYTNGEVADGIAVNDGITFSGGNTANLGNTTLTITYEGFSIDVTVQVIEKAWGLIVSTELPQSITGRDDSKAIFRDSDKPYVVGNANEFIFTLTLIQIVNGEPVNYAMKYKSTSSVYLVTKSGDTETQTLLSGDELAKYVTVDEDKNSFKFTDEARDRVFMIKTAPEIMPNAHKTLTVKVVDAYNVYNAKQLNVLTNIDTTVGPAGDQFSQLEVVNEFLANNGIVRPAKLNGIVLHNDIRITTNDVPSRYIGTYDNAGVVKTGLYDQLSVYNHGTSAAEPVFNFYGNYYTITSMGLPCVADQGFLDNSDELSNSQLFMFSVTDESYINANFKNYNPSTYTTNVYDLALRDNDPNEDTPENSPRRKLGVIAVKTRFHTINYVNSRIEAYFISFMNDGDHQIINLDKVYFFNAWQNHIFSHADNMVWRHNGAAAEVVPADSVYYPIQLNITDSMVAKCGGPVIISQTKLIHESYPEGLPANNRSETIFNIDELTATNDEGNKTNGFYANVVGEEAWFQAFKLNPVVAQIKSLSMPLQGTAAQMKYSASFLKPVQNSSETKMNIVAVNMYAASGISIDPNVAVSPDDINAITKDVDGKMVIGGKTVYNMKEGSAEDNMMQIFMQTTYLVGGTVAPIYSSSDGGFCAFNGVDGVFGLDLSNGQPAMALPDAACFTGNYITLYFQGIAIVFEYVH